MPVVRFRALLIAAAFAVAACGPVSAQEKEFSQAPEKLPKVQRGQDLDFLFGALKVAPDAEAAKAVEGRIWAVWTVSKSDTAMLLMSRVKTAVEAKNLDL